ncbi:hypothetical protein K9L67_03545 [Candidatus Woesearchaeota archaeon]|nr:hypothetical protein [Candidatus Woesearchaeota archaeon]MCF7901275.1 hypothetical protein [Candidatus Woesearchaeota archaeon]MCF8013558.1 hypothetical protein [Candidatus Woesearchaeota archaeon]
MIKALKEFEIKQKENYTEIQYNRIIVGQAVIEKNELVITIDTKSGIDENYFREKRTLNPKLNKIKGSEIYDSLLETNKDKFKKIRSVINYGDNLKTINELQKTKNESLDKLIFETFSGKMAKKHEMNNVDIRIAQKKSDSNDYQTIVAIFYK